ncbi:hypothetical protein ACOQFL_07190 [Actinopolyspora sp. H202]|uniref:hypothetical protein n=1 Tax=Actinopolyspora sp. H202 TaxID=1500456 RepID=UPI003EE5C89D
MVGSIPVEEGAVEVLSGEEVLSEELAVTRVSLLSCVPSEALLLISSSDSLPDSGPELVLSDGLLEEEDSLGGLVDVEDSGGSLGGEVGFSELVDPGGAGIEPPSS